MLREINMNKTSQLTPRKALLYDAVKMLKRKNVLVQKCYSEAKNRIKMADKFISTNK